jgi:pimeloyl-ACP methyl ester carboxylesterase
MLLTVIIVATSFINAAGQSVMQGTAHVNGTKLYYETKGRGFPIVFISGGGILDRRGWDQQFDLFSKQYRVIRYDVRGIGKSARPEGPFSHSKDLYKLLTFLKVRRAHVVGLSVGAAIAIDFAIEHPEIVDGLILASPGLSSDSKSDGNMQSLTAIAGLVKTNGIEQVIQLTLDAPFVLSKGNSDGREKVRQIYLDNKDIFEAGFPLYVLWQPVIQPENKLATIRARVLIIRGDNDNPAYARMTDRIQKGIPKAKTIVIRGGTHFLNLEKPSEFNQALLAFLRH